MLKKHRKEIHKRIVNTKKKPRKVISKRENELLVLMKNDVDWIETEHLDVELGEISHDKETEFNNLISIGGGG